MVDVEELLLILFKDNISLVLKFSNAAHIPIYLLLMALKNFIKS